MHKVQDKPAQAVEALQFFDWAYKNGSKLASDLDYVPMPDVTVKLIRASGLASRTRPARRFTPPSNSRDASRQEAGADRGDSSASPMNKRIEFHEH
jgi:hypothetical protein